MASIKNLKKELVYTYGALLDECYIVQMVILGIDTKEIDAICDEIENQYAQMAAAAGSLKGKKEAAVALRKDFDASVDALAEKLKNLVEKK
jgi:ABC-type Fe3+-hydroxamate transport system substrate-binding protein